MEETNRIEEKLADIKEYLGELGSRLTVSFEDYKAADVALKRLVERDLQLINDSEIDILGLLVKMKELSIASSEEALIDKFVKIFDKKTIAHLKEFRRLRNVLTHAYKSETYDESVFNAAKELADVHRFMQQIEKILSTY